jgi:hypothetical protein
MRLSWIAVPDLLDRIRRELADRIGALRPMAEEYDRLRRAADALDRVGAAEGADSVPARSGPRPAARTRSAPARRSPGSRRGRARAAPGQTQARVVEQLRNEPGSTSTAVAAALGISANAAAATISRLVKQGRVQRLQTGGYAAPADAPRADDAPAPPAAPSS